MTHSGIVRFYFNSRPSARGDLLRLLMLLRLSLFQFTPLREGRLALSSTLGEDKTNFNSRPSARGDGNPYTPLIRQKYFNSRPSARGDGTSPAHGCWRRFISIHAPPRGATKSQTFGIEIEIFQFTPLREGRQAENGHEKGGKKFQFTPLREGRRLLLADSFDVRLHFNSRPSARGDLETVQKSLESFISIHAPPRGATQGAVSDGVASVFQFTPLREGRRVRQVLG